VGSSEWRTPRSLELGATRLSLLIMTDPRGRSHNPIPTCAVCVRAILNMVLEHCSAFEDALLNSTLLTNPTGIAESWPETTRLVVAGLVTHQRAAPSNIVPAPVHACMMAVKRGRHLRFPSAAESFCNILSSIQPAPSCYPMCKG
jgi:hypothetical protein